MTNVFYPNTIPMVKTKSIFLAGTIDQGNSHDWQAEFIEAAEKTEYLAGSNYYNPRREDWDPNWGQDSPELQYQIQWEMYWMHQVDSVFMYFAADSQSPITLLELGYWAARDPQKLFVYCDENFWRIGNVEAICEQESVYWTSEDLTVFTNQTAMEALVQQYIVSGTI